MTAASFEEIYDYEGCIEPVFKRVLEADGITTHIQRSADLLRTPYISIKLEMGAARGQKAFDRQRRIRDAHFDATLTVAVVTNRTEDHGDHSAFRARVRNLFQQFPAVFTREMLPFHAIPLVRPAGDAPDIEAKDDLDVSALSYQLVICIRPDAWPLAV